MNDHPNVLFPETAPSRIPPPPGAPGDTRLRIAVVAALAAAFAVPLFHLFRFSLGTELYSHVVLIPVVSGYLAWLRRKELPRVQPTPSWLANAAILTGLALLGGYVMTQFSQRLPVEDSLALAALAFLLVVAGLVVRLLGPAMLRSLAFPVGFLIFMVPMPTWVVQQVEALLQHGSADAAFVMFHAVGTPVFRQELIFQLPGITLEVAPECSGIRSTLALFIVSIVAGQMFLVSPWKRVLLAFAVLPLALLRNGLRVFVIGELCVRISPDMINSYIHHHGGPVFFVLSLVPFSLLLALLVKSERSRPARSPAPI